MSASKSIGPPKADSAEIARRIASLRRSLGKTQKEFADALEVSQTTVSEWEQGEYLPSSENYIKLGNLAPLYEHAAWFYGMGGVNRGKMLSISDLLLKEAEASRAGIEIAHVPSITKTSGSEKPPFHLPFPAWMLFKSGAPYFARVTDSFMSPLYEPEDILLIDSSERELTNLEDSYVAIWRDRPKGSSKLQMEHAQKGLEKRIGKGGTEEFRRSGRYPFPHFGLFVGWLRSSQSPGEATAFRVEAASPAGVRTSEAIAFLRPSGSQSSNEKFVLDTNDEISFLGRVIAWSRQPPKKQ